MKKTGFFLLAVLCTYTLTGCTANTTPGANTNAAAASNAANTNAAKPVAAAPTADALLAMDKQANEAYFKGDGKFFEGFLSDKAAMGQGALADKASLVKMIGSVKCDMKTWTIDDPKMAMIDNDTYVVSYKGTYDGTCNDGPGGKDIKAPSPIRSATVYVRNGDKWQAVYHAENPIIDPKNPPAPPKAEKKADDKKAAGKPAGDKKDDAKAPEKPTPPARSANTDALVAKHQAGWEAFKAKDAKWFEANSTANLNVLDPMGNYLATKSDVIKAWTEAKCEGITTVKVSDGYSISVSPTVEMLFAKGNADGKCDGQKNGDLYQTAFYVKEGNDWKIAFMTESMPMSGM